MPALLEGGRSWMDTTREGGGGKLRCANSRVSVRFHPGWRALSLKGQWTLWIGLLFAAAAAACLLGLPVYMEAQARRWTLHHALETARLVASITRPALAHQDAAEGRRQLELLAALPEARFGVLLRPDGTPLASWNGERAPEALPEQAEVWLHRQEVLTRLRLTTPSGEEGTLLVGFGTQELQHEGARVRQQAACFSALLLLLGLLIARGLGELLVRPLERIARVARQLGLEGSGTSANPLAAEFHRLIDWMYEQGDIIESMVCEVRLFQERLHEQTELLASGKSELLQMRDQLVVADRRASVGTLSAGVAHEINNPLAYITANIQFATQELRRLEEEQPRGEPLSVRSEDAREMLNALAEAGDGCSRVQHIVVSLKSFAAGDDGRVEPLEISHALRTSINMASNEVRHRARLVQDFQDVAAVDGNPVRLSQVFLNLLINAAHAIEPGAVEANEIRVSTRMGTDGRVRVSITDTGGGMTPEVRARLFTPFFTTKPVGVGTGLGLSVCQGIIHGMGGQIEVQSEPTRGSTFTVILPPSEALREAHPRVSAPVLQTRRARILVVDDEPRVGGALRRALSAEHEVVVTSGAREALAHVCQGPRFDVILCDVMMPEMNGMQLFEELQRTDPSQAQAVLFLTGGALTDVAGDFLARMPERVLSKPLDMEVLRERLRGFLEPQAVLAPRAARTSPPLHEAPESPQPALGS